MIRSLVERSPAVASALRAARDDYRWRTARASTTPHGFSLAGNELWNRGALEVDETTLVLDLLEQFDVFVDVGANIGFYTCLALRHGKKAIAFEPLPQNVRVLCGNLRDNGWQAEVWPIGLANEPGIAFLFGGDTGASLIEGWAGVSPEWRQPVPLNTLDNLLAHRLINERLLIKIDVEGAEFGVLQGARRILERGALWLVEITLDAHRPERNPNFVDTFELFWRHGYTCRSVDAKRHEVTRAEILSFLERPADNINWLFSRP